MTDPALRTTLVDLSLRVTALEQAVSVLDDRVVELEVIAQVQDQAIEEIAGRLAAALGDPDPPRRRRQPQPH